MHVVNIWRERERERERGKRERERGGEREREAVVYRGIIKNEHALVPGINQRRGIRCCAEVILSYKPVLVSKR